MCREVFSSSVVVIVLIIGLLLAAHFEAHDLILFAFFPLIVLTLFYEPLSARFIFANRAVHHLGVVSYSLYLAHPLFVPVKTRLQPVAERYLGNVAHSLTLALVILLSWGSACFLYRFVEVPGRLYVQRLFLRRSVAESV